MNDLMQKLAISKKIMDIHNKIPRNSNDVSTSLPVSDSLPYMNENAEIPITAKYSIPEEFLTPQQTQRQIPTHSPVITEDKIKNSKLPDAIKKLMIEHPIETPQQYQATISDDIIEGATRLMKKNGMMTESQPLQTQKTQPKQTKQPTQTSSNDLKNMIREVLEEVLAENGLLVESTQKANEIVQIKVGKHIFEGKIVKIKQTSK